MLPPLPSRTDVDLTGNQESTEHGDCQGKHKGRRQLQPKLHMTVMATDNIPDLDICLSQHLYQLPPSFLMKLPFSLILTLPHIDGATGSQSGPGDSAYGEFWPQCPVPFLGLHNQIHLGYKQTLNSQMRLWNCGLLGSKGGGGALGGEHTSHWL